MHSLSNSIGQISKQLKDIKLDNGSAYELEKKCLEADQTGNRLSAVWNIQSMTSPIPGFTNSGLDTTMQKIIDTDVAQKKLQLRQDHIRMNQGKSVEKSTGYCSNCGAQRTGQFCSTCGTRF